MNITLSIIDDEDYAIVLLRNFIEELDLPVSIVSSSTCVATGVEKVEQIKPDIILLDIQIKNRTGFDLLERLSYQPIVIITSAYDHYGIQAIKNKAYDYLLKPIDKSELKKALDEAIKTCLRSKMRGLEDDKYHKTKLKLSGNQLVSISEIVYCEAEGNYCRIHFSNGKKQLLSKPLKYLEERIDSPLFQRPHQTYFINVSYITAVRSDQVELKGSIEIPISRSRKAQFMEAISDLENIRP